MVLDFFVYQYFTNKKDTEKAISFLHSSFLDEVQVTDIDSAFCGKKHLPLRPAKTTLVVHLLYIFQKNTLKS